MGGLTAAMASAARSFGAEIRTEAPVAQHHHRRRAGHRRGPRGRRGARPPRSSSPPLHPQISLPPPARPRRAARRLRRRHRAVEHPLGHGQDQRRRRPAARVHVQARLRPRGARRHDRPRPLARRGRDGVPGRRRRPAARPGPFADICIPSVFDPTLAPEGHHIVSMFTPVGAARLGRQADATPSSTPTPTALIDTVEEVAPGFTELDPAPHGHRPARDGARVRPRRRQHLPRRAVAEPAVPPPPGRRLRRLPHADRRALPGRLGDPRRRRRHRHPGAAGRAPDRARRTRRALAARRPGQGG